MKTMQTTHDPRILEVRHLRLVRAIAREASVTRAASTLHLSQSAVSHQLVDLEHDLGTRLFDRVGKKMVLTQAGSRVLDVAERMLRELESVEREMQSQRTDARVALRVTVSCYTSYHWLPAALEHFGKKHPKVDLSIVLEATRRANEALALDEVDLAIVNDPPRDEAYAAREVITSELVAVGRPDHEVIARSGGRSVLHWSDLRHATVLVHDVSDQNLARLVGAVRDSWEKRSGERLANPIDVRKVPLTEALIELARAGVGVALVDRWLVCGYLDDEVKAFPFAPRWERTFSAIFRRANPRGLPIDELVDVIAREASRCIRPTKRN